MSDSKASFSFLHSFLARNSEAYLDLDVLTADYRSFTNPLWGPLIKSSAPWKTALSGKRLYDADNDDDHKLY